MKQLIAMIPETDEEKANHDLTHNFVTLDGRLTDAGNALVEVAIEVLNRACFKNAFAHGWYEKYMKPEGSEFNVLGERNFGEVMALITSEVSEAFEAYRDGDPVTEIKYGYKIPYEGTLFSEDPSDAFGQIGVLGKPEGVPAELADVLIRVFDFCGAYRIPLGEAIIRKHRYNESRPYRHGGKLA